jgi:hypothetical protein
MGFPFDRVDPIVDRKYWPLLNGARAVHEPGREVGGGSHAGNALWRTFRCRSAFPVAVSIGVILGTLSSIALVASRQRRGDAAGPAHGTA